MLSRRFIYSRADSNTSYWALSCTYKISSYIVYFSTNPSQSTILSSISYRSLMASTCNVQSNKNLSCITCSLISRDSTLSFSMRSFRVFLKRSMFLAVLLSASESATFSEPSRKISSYAISLSSFRILATLHSYMLYRSPDTTSISSLLPGSSLAILSTEFFCSTNSSILMTIPVRDRTDCYSHYLMYTARFLKRATSNSSSRWSYFYYRVRSEVWIASVYTLKIPRSV